MIKSEFKVNGIDFKRWFNTRFRLTNQLIWQNVIDANGFAELMKYLKDFTGKDEINLQEFCGHFAIMYNETGGTFKPLREFGGPAYCFNTVMPGGGLKHSYNKAPNKLAGNQLKEWGIISEKKEVDLWNGQVYPTSSSEQVKKASLKCDFYRFRGYGLNQLTWRDAFEKCLQPLLPKKIDDYNYDEFELILQDVKLACKTYYNYLNANNTAKFAFAELQKGNFVPYGNLVSGGWTWYVVNKYVPRCQSLYNSLRYAKIENIEKYAIDGLNLNPQTIKLLQNIISGANAEAKKIIDNSGGCDGFWGDATQKAFNLLHTTIDELLKKTSQ